MQRLRTLLLVSTALMPLGLSHVLAGPNGATVVGGNATVQNQGTANVTVNQFSDKAIINWNLFNIGVGEKTTFVQPNSNSVALNRITGGQGPSEILGSLDANGKVFLINRDGFIFGAGAVVTTAGFLATTSDIKNQDFMAGRYNFQTPGRPDASIVNMGTITATSGGFAALVAPGVRNSGTITATLGTVALAAGNTFNLDFYGDKLVTIGVGDEIAGKVKDVATGETLKSLVTNEGKLKANGGRVELTAAAARHVVDSVINTSGVIEANSVGMKNGQIVLGAATASTKGGATQSAGAAKQSLPKQTVRVSGTVSASGQEKGTKGGSIIVTGEHIEVAGATIDASGRDGGGKVLIGGDWAGGKPDKSLVNNQSAQLEANAIPTASTVTVDAATRIDASAKDRGDGGKVILWSDQTTTFAGTILALGGREFGNGGFAEVSGKGVLDFTGAVDLKAANGNFGTLLLDPFDMTISTALNNASQSGNTFGPNGPGSVLNVTTLTNALSSASVVVTTGNASSPGTEPGDIFVNAPIVWNASTTLTLSAARNVNIAFVGGSTGAIQNTGGGNLIIRADNSGTGTGTINLAAGTDPGRINWGGSSGTVTFYYNPTVFGTQNNFTTGNGRVVTNGLAPVPNQFTAYMLVNTTSNLQAIGTNTSTLGEKYALGKDINAAGPTFTPLGSVATPFTGKFEGQGFIISGLNISPAAGNSSVGMFSSIGTGATVSNFTLKDVQVSATGNGQFLGPLAGQNNGTVTNVHVTASSPGASTVTAGPAFSGIIAGGLVGQNTGNLSIHNSSSAANVTIGDGTTGPGGGNSAGGLVGTNTSGLIANSTASGNVQGGANAFIGGLAGRNDNGTVQGSSATGNVTTTATNAFGTTTGGLVGFSGTGSTITGSTASGNVSTNAGGMGGGLVAQNEGNIASSSYSGGTVSGSGVSGNQVILGGLVGTNNTGGQISNSTASGTINLGAFGNAGGLVGGNNASISNSSSSVTVNATGNGVIIGGLVGTNFVTGTIASSRATGNVTSSYNALTPFDGTAAGGLVGANFGTINGNAAAPTAATACTSGQTCATGAVSVGSHGGGGGLVAMNQGAITNTFATGAVTGAVGLGENTATVLGGLVGFNNSTGTITGSHARGGNVGSNVAFLLAGGLVGDNLGSVANSFSSRNVIAGNQSQVGGLAGVSGGDCPGCLGTITNSSATGSVTAGTGSIAGGLVGGMGENSTFTGLSASNTVTAGADSVIGGLVGALAPGAVLSNSQSSGTVTGTGANVMAGGLVGMSFGTVSNSSASGTVSVAGDSFGGGLVGGNIGRVENSSAAATAAVTGGFNSIVGGLAGLNAGTVTGSNAANAVTTGNFGVAGGLVGGNVAFEGVPPGLTLPGSSFPNGTIVSSTATGTVSGGISSTVGGLIGLNGGSISGLTASNSVSGGSSSIIGGLVGVNSGPSGGPDLPGAITGCFGCGLSGVSISSGPGSIANSTASGNISGGQFSYVGGLVGSNPGTITNSSASNSIVGNSFAVLGGLVGQNEVSGTITGSSATGAMSGALFVGGLAGMNLGAIATSNSSGNVTGTLGSTSGGLVGANFGSIANSSSSSSVTGGEGSTLGGLVGINAGTVTNSFSTGTVTADPSIAGGLAGINIGTISGSWASGAVTGDAGSFVGGLVGFNLLGTIENSYSVSKVTVGDGGTAGGLVAANLGAISQSFATGAVSGGIGSYVGGLVAYNFGNAGIPGAPLGTISQSYATGAVTGGAASVVGGLVAENAGSIDQAYATGLVTAGLGSVTGGLVASNNFTVPSASSFPGNSSPPPSAPPPGFTSTPGTATNSYWDTQTTGQSQSAGGTPQTTAQMTSGIPSGFSPAAWSSGNGHYPFLTGQPDPLPLPGPPAPVDPLLPHHPPETPDHPAIKQPEPVINLVLQQTNEAFTEKKQEEVVNTSTPSSSGGSAPGSPGGQKGGNPAGNNARPPIGAIAGYGLGPLPSGMPPLNETRFINDEVMFQFGARLSDRELASMLDQLGLRVMYRQELGLLGRLVLRLKLPPGATVRSVIAAFEAKGANFSGQPLYQYEMVQDVAQAPSPADTNRKGDSAQYIVEKLGLVEAHLLATGKGVKVAVIDSEIDSKHPDLEGAITGTFDALPSDDQTAHPHGTGMAGAIASHKRLLGVAPGAQLLAVRAFGVNTGGAQGTSLNIVKGLQWAVDQGAKVINMSFAGPRDPILQQAMKRLTDQGIILIGAAGNAGPKSPPLFPGADPNVIAVSATDVDDKTYKNANRGKYVAIAAPGVDILVPAPEGGYQLTTGTSVAAAHISGVVALMLERNKELRPAEVRSILSATAKKIGGPATDVGAGLVDPVQALSKAGPKQAQVR